MNKDKEIGQRIRAIRRKHGLSQEKMAEILGIHSTTHYQNIEYGKKRVATAHLEILYERFEATPNYILFGIVGNAQEYVYNFMMLPADEKLKLYLEITRSAWGAPQHDFEIVLKNNENPLHEDKV